MLASQALGGFGKSSEVERGVMCVLAFAGFVAVVLYAQCVLDVSPRAVVSSLLLCVPDFPKERARLIICYHRNHHGQVTCT